MLVKEVIAKNLDKLLRDSPVIDICKEDRFVIFSDLHLGDGSRKDDFLKNGKLFSYVLENCYLNNNYKLILNGDIEELQRFSYKSICKHWKSIYTLFDAFNSRQGLYKIIGNHDYVLILKGNKTSPYRHYHSLVLKNGEDILFVFHSHQASLYYTKHNALIGFVLKYLAHPLGIKNYSVAYNSKKQFKIEKRVYEYSSSRKIASLIGHTHRPLFESLSKRDELVFEIEKLIRGFSIDSKEEVKEKQKKLLSYKEELIRLNRNKKESLLSNSLYNSDILVPCLFNSGCVIGGHGMTCLEIVNNQISLVHYFDKTVKYAHWGNEEKAEKLGNTDFYRIVINQEDLGYIFTKIKYLS